MSISVNTNAAAQPIIDVKNVTKEYRLGGFESLRTILARLSAKKTPPKNRFKALDDVTFSIQRGEVVGIIGHNGAGKSTLLKHLCRITVPTKGTISVRGRVAPLIEVGAGLIGDLTGRENVFLNAAILGLSRAEIENKFDEIVEFAELQEFIDTPVKRYSSGMQMRLGFSIATAVDADILIVDEVLAVGDVAFQKKCIDRMEEVIRGKEKTVLLVGHNIRQIERICNRMILLEHGKIKAVGTPGEIAKIFLADSIEHALQQPAAAGHTPFGNDGGSSEVVIHRIEINETEVLPGECVKTTLFEAMKIRFYISSKEEFPDSEINVGLHTPEMTFMVKSSSRMHNKKLDLPKGLSMVEITVPNINLTPGIYGLGVGAYDWSRRSLCNGASMIWIEIDSPENEITLLPSGTLTHVKSSFTIQKTLSQP